MTSMLNRTSDGAAWKARPSSRSARAATLLLVGATLMLSVLGTPPRAEAAVAAPSTTAPAPTTSGDATAVASELPVAGDTASGTAEASIAASTADTATAATAPATTVAPVLESASITKTLLLDTIVLIDTSAGMSGTPLATATKLAAEYITALPSNVRVGVVTFGQFPVAMYQLTNDRASALATLSALTTDGDPSLYDGVSFAADQFDLATLTKRQIVVFGSGSDSESIATQAEVLTMLRQRNIRVDSVVVPAPDTTAEDIKQFVAQTGGMEARGSDSSSVAELTKQTASFVASLAAAQEAAVPKPKKPIPLSTKLTFGVGLLMLFIGLTFVVQNALSPKPKKVNLTGFSPLSKDAARGLGPQRKTASTPVGEIAEKLSVVADKALEKQGRDRGLSVSLERAGIAMKPGEFVITAMVVLGVIFGLLLQRKGIMWAGPITAVLTVFGPRKFLARKIAKRSATFGDMLSDTLQLISSSLRAGQGLMQAIDSVAKEGDEPAASEFRRVVTEVRLGRDLIDSLRAMADRVQSEDFNWVIPAIEINREVGGDLAEVLDTVSGTIRDRADIRRQVKTLSAEGRLSAYVLLALPIVIALFIQMSNPEYLAELRVGLGLYLAGGAVLMMVIGAVWLFRLCKIDF